ncbi:MAG: hypothetical protein RM022_030490 [Nostoc sp. EfeVER01]|uniref:hypothetical protein n=1 Tax=Nostoc sp. EfeVER01 TaxID=3075406 RepID=UPI002AD625CD|nr:hypothetical protein [Nostoc sp. EfeVER01]MDZ7996266.1 hypothetical protein [Nostoc sp. EspVER01]
MNPADFEKAVVIAAKLCSICDKLSKNRICQEEVGKVLLFYAERAIAISQASLFTSLKYSLMEF